MLRNLADIQWCTHAPPLSGTRLRTTGSAHGVHAEATVFLRVYSNNMDIIKYCQSCFDFEMPSVLWAKRANKLNEKCLYCDNMFVKRL